MAAVHELQTGLWHWEASHPDWTPGNPEDEGAKVTSYAIDEGERLLLIDPLAVPREIEELAADRETAIVLTCAWHERVRTPGLPRPDPSAVTSDPMKWSLREPWRRLARVDRVKSASSSTRKPRI